MRRLLLPMLGSLLVAVVLAGAGAAPAWAHTRLVSSTPAQGAPAVAPGALALVFSERVQAGLSAVSVTGADGAERASGSPVAGDDDVSVSQTLSAPLEPGTYLVAYRVLAADGHPVTGSFEITAVAAPAATSAPAPTATPEATSMPALRPAADESDEDAGLPLLPLAAGGLAVAGAAGVLARRFSGGSPGA